MTDHPTTEAHTCHDHCPLCQPPGTEDQPDGIANDSLDLPEPARAAVRVREFLSEFGDGLVPVDCVAAPLYARDLETLTKLDESRYRLQNRVLWLGAELADMTAQLRHRDESMAILQRERNQYKAEADAYDDMKDCAETAEAERESWREYGDAWRAAAVRWRDERDEERTQRQDVEAKLDTAQAEVKELREELEHWTSGRRRKGLPRVESVPDAVARAAEMVRSSYEGDLPDDIADVMRGNAHRMRVLHDAASTLTAERDALQARIDAALTWCDTAADGYENDFERGYHRCAGRVRLALQPTPPADDGSEAERCVCPHCSGVVGGSRGCLPSDAENESPPFKAGDYVRDADGYVWRVLSCHLDGDQWVVFRKRGDWGGTQHASKLEPWQPRKGERVVTLHGGVREVYDVHASDPDRVALSPSYSVPISQLRPAGGGE